MNNLAIIFPPAHDFTMPYTAPFLLKSYIEKNTNINVDVLDINLLFFMNFLDDSHMKNEKNKIKKSIKNKDLVNSVKYVIDYEKNLINNLRSNFLKYKDYNISLRKISANFDMLNQNNIFNEINNKNPFKEIVKNILISKIKNKTKIFAISVTIEDQVFFAFLIAKIIKELYKDSIIVFGGNIITRTYEALNTELYYNIVDYLVIGEGEEPLEELVNKYIKNKNTILSNKIFKVTKKCLISNELNKINKNIFTIPDFSNIIWSNYNAIFPILPILLSKKCAWGKCDFCSIHKSWDGGHSLKPKNDIQKELSFAERNNIRYIRIVDEDANPKILLNLIKLLDNKKLIFEAYARLEREFLEIEYCHKLYKYGFRQFFFGLESISKTTLKQIKKGLSLNKKLIQQIFKNNNTAGIHNYVFILIGIPNTSIKDEEETIKYIISDKNIHTISLGTFVVDKMSPIHTDYSIRSKYNIKLLLDDRFSTEVKFEVLHNKKDIITPKERAEKYLKEIFNSRVDLALTTILTEEDRLLLIDYFGNDFAQKYINTISDKEKVDIITKAITITIVNKIDRKLNVCTVG